LAKYKGSEINTSYFPKPFLFFNFEEMSKHNELTMKQAIQEMMKAYRLQPRMDELNLMASWAKVTGPMVQNRTKDLSIRNKVLYVKLDSAALREELSYNREKLIQRLNEEAGLTVINQVIFI
jgi:predicted nucleic acid-binding Zn ribbon protein